MSSDRPVTKIKIPRTVWVLGFVSLLMDISSEMIHALLPLFMAGTLGASAIWIGLVEGIGEGTALIAKVFSGVVADRFGHKKRLVFAGYCRSLFRSDRQRSQRCATRRHCGRRHR